MQQDSDIATLQAKILAFAAERDWQQFHDPKNLAMAVAVEAGELMDHFRWVSNAEAHRALDDAKTRAGVEEEAADVMILLLELAAVAKIDLKAAVERKLREERRALPRRAREGQRDEARQALALASRPSRSRRASPATTRHCERGVTGYAAPLPTPILASLVAAAALALQQVAITNVTVIDPEKGTATDGRVILIDGPRITNVSDQALVRLDGRVPRIDGTGLFAYPGLIDSHVHFGDPATFGPLCVAHGVTAVRDMGGDTDAVLALRGKLNAGEEVGPRMIATGAIIDGTPPVWPFSEACATPEEGRAAVHKLKTAGVDQIKVYSKLAPEVYRAVVAEAKAVGLKAVGHVPASVTIDDAIAAGQSTNEHLMRAEEFIVEALPADAPRPTRAGAAGGVFSTFGYWALYPQADKTKLRAALARLAQSGMVQCPTLVVQQGIARAGDGSGERDERMAFVSPMFSEFWKGDTYANYAKFVEAAIPSMKEMVGEMHKAGVPIIAGTDLANPYVFAGSSLHEEMRNLVDVGMTPAEALRAATSRPPVPRVRGSGRGRGGQARVVRPRARESARVDRERGEDRARLPRGQALRPRRARWASREGEVRRRRSEEGRGDRRRRAGRTHRARRSRPSRRYRMKFGKFDAGSEEFLITKTDDGYHIVANSNPKGGMQPPSRSHIVLDNGRKVRSATWESVTEDAVRAEYTVEGGMIRAKARKVESGAAAKGPAADTPAADKPVADQPAASAPAADEPESQDFRIEGPSMLALPATPGDFSTLYVAGLKVGEKFEGKSVMWGQFGWGIAAAPYTAERRPDETLKHRDVEITVHRYAGVLTTPAGKLRSTPGSTNAGCRSSGR